MGLMEAAMDDLMRHSNLERSMGWEYEAIEIIERVDDMIEDWFVSADDAVALDDGTTVGSGTESRLGSTIFFGSIGLAAVGSVVATLVQ